MVEAFLHKGNLTHQEVDCLVSTVGDVAFGAYESAESVASLFGQLHGLHGPGARAEAPPPGPLVVLRLARSMHGLVHVLDGVMGSCVKGRSLELLTEAGEHLRNLTYVAGRLAANGADIVEELSDAAAAFQGNDYKRFGSDVGTACRKVLLSNASSELLPEGPPSPAQLVNVSAGLLQGFFGAGFELTIASDARIVTQPRKHTMDLLRDGSGTGEGASEVVVSEDKARLNVHIDLHRCVSRNVELFRAVVSKAWLYFAEAALQPSGRQTRRLFAVMLRGLPGALARCGVEPRQQAMLAESIHSLRHVELRLRMPEGPASAGGAAKELRAAAAHWGSSSWFDFGTDLGRMLQGIVVRAHPDRYALASTGSLQRVERAAAAVAGEAAEQLERADAPSADDLARGGFKSADELGVGSGLSATGAQIVEGIAEGLLHRRELPRSEAQCLMESVGDVLKGASQTAEGLVEVFDELFAAGEAGAAPADAAELMGELSRSFDGVARLAEGFMAQCRSEAAAAFRLALRHLGSMRAVTGRLVANGADVQEGIDRAVASWKRREPRAFGRAVGTVCRKALLSGRPRPVVLPEGAAAAQEIVNVSAGVLEGFFGRGFEIDISSDRRIATTPLFPLVALAGDGGGEGREAEAKRLNVHIDLHSCVERNLPFFQSIITGAVQLFALEEAAQSPGGLFDTPALMAALAQLPAALRRCGIDGEQEQMLVQSMGMLGSLNVRLHLPQSGAAAGTERTAELLKRCVSDWSKLRWLALGKDLGQMLREALLAALPALYQIDDLGTLRTRLLGLSDAARGETAQAVPHTLASVGPLLPAGALTLLAAGLVAARAVVVARRRLGSGSDSRHSTDADHDAEDFEAGLVRAGALE